MTVLGTRFTLTPNVAMGLNDTLTVAVGRCRNVDFGTNVVNGLGPATGNYKWFYYHGFAFNGTLTINGGNTIAGRVRTRYKIGADFDGYGLFLTNPGAVAGATQYRLWSTTWVALP